MAISCIICEIKRDIGRKSWFFHTTLAFNPPPIRGVPVGILPPRLVLLEWWGYPTVKKMLRICVIVRHNTGVWQTDGRTDILPRRSPRYAYASRSNNWFSFGMWRYFILYNWRKWSYNNTNNRHISIPPWVVTSEAVWSSWYRFIQNKILLLWNTHFVCQKS